MSLENFDKGIPSISSIVDEGPFSRFSGTEKLAPKYPNFEVTAGSASALSKGNAQLPNVMLVCGADRENHWQATQDMGFRTSTPIADVEAFMHTSGEHLPQDALAISSKNDMLDIVVCDGVTGLDPATKQILGVASGVVSKYTALSLASVGVDRDSIVNARHYVGRILSDRELNPDFNDTTVQGVRIAKNNYGKVVMKCYCIGAEKDLGFVSIYRAQEDKVYRVDMATSGFRLNTGGEVVMTEVDLVPGDEVFVSTDAYKNPNKNSNTKFVRNARRRRSLKGIPYESDDDATVVRVRIK